MDLLVLNYNDASTTIQYVESVKGFSCLKRILIVDNCSTDDSFKALERLSSEKIIVIKTDKNGGYGYGNNFGIRYLYANFKSRFVLLSNPDVIVEENVLYELQFFLEQRNDYAVVAPFMCNSNGKKCGNSALKIPSKRDFILSTNWLFELLRKPFLYNKLKLDLNPVKDVDTVAGSFFLMNTEFFMKSGLFDESIFLYWEEIVLGIKIRKIKKKIALLTNISFIHNHSVSIDKTYKSAVSKKKLFVKSKLYVLKKYYHANFVEYFFACCLAKISLLDCLMVPWLLKIYHKFRSILK